MADPEIAKTQQERKKLEQQNASPSTVTCDTEFYHGYRWEEETTHNPRRLLASSDTPAATPLDGLAVKFLQKIPEQYSSFMRLVEKDIEERNRPLTDEELDSILCPHQGFKILDPPLSYVPIINPVILKLLDPPASPTWKLTEENPGKQLDFPKEFPGGLPIVNPQDRHYFIELLNEAYEYTTPEEQKEREILKLLLMIKNGTPLQRETALTEITDKAREFGAAPLFNKILPLLMQPLLEDQERRLLVEVIDRVLCKLDELVRPFVHKILVVIEPLLVDDDCNARAEGREIISSLSRAAGLDTMVSAMRPDIDNVDDYVRNTTAKAFSVVASALGIPALLPFLKDVCQSKGCWRARHTGIKIVQQIAILIGSAVLPHLKSLVEIIKHGLVDEDQKVMTITALSLSALAEASAPYGIECFDCVQEPLWRGIRSHRGKVSAGFLTAIGFIIPLMDAKSSHYTKEMLATLISEFQSPGEEMKRIVLKVVKQCVSTEGAEADYVRSRFLTEFFKKFWERRMALDCRNYNQLVETTVEIANRVGVADIVRRIVEDLKDESEPNRRMVMETIEKVVANLGASDIGAQDALVADYPVLEDEESNMVSFDALPECFCT